MIRCIGFLVGLRMMSELMADLPNGHPGCLVASYCYQDRLFDKEVRAINASAVLNWRKRFRQRLDLIAERYPPRVEVDLDDLADMLSVIADGGIILSKAIKDKHVYPVKGEMNIGMGPDSVKTTIEFVETSPAPDYSYSLQQFQSSMSGYGMTEQQQKKVYTLVVHGALHFDFTNPDSLWEQLVEQGLVVPIAPAKPELTFDPNLPAETMAAKVFTFKNICNHTLNVCGVELEPGLRCDDRDAAGFLPDNRDAFHEVSLRARTLLNLLPAGKAPPPLEFFPRGKLTSAPHEPRGDALAPTWF